MMSEEHLYSTITQAELLGQMQAGWDELNAYLNTLTYRQLTGLTDAGGWTIKDHVMHLAVWEDGLNAVLEKRLRREQMGIDAEMWQRADFDEMNAVIQQRYRDLTWENVISAFTNIHQRLIAKIEALGDEDVMRPYCYFQPWTSAEMPVVHAIIESGCGHYAEHRPWIEAIAAGE